MTGHPPRLDQALKQLGLPALATEEQAWAAFRRLAAEAHPEGHGSAVDPGRAIAELELARDVVVEAARQRRLPVIAEVRDLVLAQTAALSELGTRRELSARAATIQRTLLRRETSRLVQRRRAAQYMIGACAGLAALSGLFRSVAVAPFNQGFIGAVLVTLGLLAAVATLLAWILGERVRRIEALIEDATSLLDDRPTCLMLLYEIEEIGERHPPWTADEFAAAIDHWAASGSAVEGTVAELARLVGTRDFQRLLVAKAREHQLLEEQVEASGERQVIVYQRAVREGG